MIPPAPPWTTDCCSSSQQSTPSHHWTATNHSRPREHPQWQSVAVLVLWQEESNASSWWLGVGRIQYGALWPESVEWRYSPLLSREQGGELAGGGAHPSGKAVRRGREEEEGASSSPPVVLPSLSVSLPHSAVASQLVPRGTWRHLVSVSTGAGTAEGCGRFSSAPVAGEEAADARLQGVTGAVTPEREESGRSAAYFIFQLSCNWLFAVIYRYCD